MMLMLNHEAWFPSKSIPKFFPCLCTDVQSSWNRTGPSQAVSTMLGAWNCPNFPGTLKRQSQFLNNSPTSSPPSNKLVFTYNSNTNRHIRFALLLPDNIPHDLVPPIRVATKYTLWQHLAPCGCSLAEACFKPLQPTLCTALGDVQHWCSCYMEFNQALYALFLSAVDFFMRWSSASVDRGLWTYMPCHSMAEQLSFPIASALFEHC